MAVGATWVNGSLRYNANCIQFIKFFASLEGLCYRPPQLRSPPCEVGVARTGCRHRSCSGPERRLGLIERQRAPVALPTGQLEANAPEPCAVRPVRYTVDAADIALAVEHVEVTLGPSARCARDRGVAKDQAPLSDVFVEAGLGRLAESFTLGMLFERKGPPIQRLPLSAPCFHAGAVAKRLAGCRSCWKSFRWNLPGAGTFVD
jgi:hypothetical protein